MFSSHIHMVRVFWLVHQDVVTSCVGVWFGFIRNKFSNAFPLFSVCGDQEAKEVEVYGLIGLRLRSRSQEYKRIVLIDQERLMPLESYVRGLG